MGATAAQVMVERGDDLGTDRSRGLIEERLGGHQDPRKAVAALKRLKRDESLDQGVRWFRCQALDRLDRASRGR